jgi:multidrug efflux pump subunit AcrB/outer membrane protein TolC
MLKKFYGNFSAVAFLIVVICALGLVQFFRLPIALYPQTSRPMVYVDVSTMGISPEDFNERYGKDIESKILSIKDVEDIVGDYSPNNANWEVEFGWGYDEEKANTQIKSILAGIESQFPKEWGGFEYHNNKSGGSNQIAFSVHSDTLSEDELYHLLDTRVKPQIEKIKDVEDAFLSQPYEKEIRITLDETKLLQWGIYPDDISRALKEKKEDLTLGRLDLKDGGKYSFYVGTKNRNAQDIGQTFLKTVGKRDILVKDVAEVALRKVTPDHVLKGNGKRGVVFGGKISEKGNIVEACRSISEIAKIELPKFSKDTEYEELINPSLYIQDAVQNVGHEVLLGVLIATFVLFLFFGSLTYTSIIAVSIPLSLIGGFIVMKLLGIEVNLISLGAMALAAGMVVDGSIVVLENIVRHFEMYTPRGVRERIDVATRAVLEVWEAVIVSLSTLIVVFAPLAFTSPLANAILGDLAKVMVCVLMISIAVSLFVIPPLFIKMGKVSEGPESIFRISRWTIEAFDKLRDKYVNSLKWVLKRDSFCKGFLLTCLLLFIGAGCIFAFVLKREILAKPDTDKVWLFVEFTDKSQDVDKVDAMISPFEDIIRKEFFSDLTHFYTYVNKKGGGILCNLKDKHVVSSFKKRMEARFKNTPFVNFHVYPWVPTSLKIPDPPLVDIEIGGSNAEQKRQTLERLVEVIDPLDGVSHVEESPDHNLRHAFSLKVDEDMVRSFSKDFPDFGIDHVYDLVRTRLKEQDLFYTFIDSDKIPVKMDFPERKWNGPQDIGDLQIKIDDKIIPVRQFFKLEPEKKWDTIHTKRGKEVVSLSVRAKDSFQDRKDEVKKDVLETIKTTHIDHSLLTFLDTEKEINENIMSLVLAMIISLLLVWLIVNLQFASFSQSLIVMMVIPLGFVGASVALLLSGSPLSINSMLGLILLCGLAVNHSILYVDFFNIQRNEGKGEFESILAAADLRFRPIMLTKLTTILGSLPIALSLGTGGEVLQTLGITICGGLAISIPLTLYAVPMSLHLMSSSSRAKRSGVEGTRAVLATVILLILAFTQAPQAFSADEGIDLKTAERLTIDYNYGQKANHANVRATRETVKQKYADLLPTVDVKWGYTYESIPQASLFVKQSIPYTPQWSQEKQVLELNERIASKTLSLDQKTLLNTLHKLYFRIQFLEKKKALTVESFAIVDRFKKESDQRYTRGFISKSDNTRSALQLLRLEETLQQVNTELESAKKQLLISIGLSGSVTLKTQLAVGDSFLKLPETDLRKYVAQQSSESIAITQLKSDSARLQTESFRYKYLPVLSAEAQFPFNEYSGSEGSSRPVYSVGVAWNLFNGGADRAEQRKLFALREQADYTLQDTLVGFASDSEEVLANILMGRNSYLKQKQGLTMWEEIVAANQKRFERGNISSKDLSDDISNYLEHATTYYKTTLDLLSNISQFCFLLGKEDLFYELLL